MTNSNITVTHENFDDMLETVILGNISLQNYNSDCFGMSDLRLADAGSYLLEKMIDTVEETGNNVFTMCQPKFLASGYDCRKHFNEEDFAHITEIKPFEVVIENGGNIFRMCENIRESVTDREQFLADHKYR